MGNQLGFFEKVLHTLDLESSEVNSVNIQVNAHETVVTISYLENIEDGESFCEILKDYQLVEK